ncbi:hypothetical protein [Pseudarthrobacter sp. NS4]|uniref:hypothetical protein n=1 Tax=Pseudarthrobacter sp. NS4 TaxID=2973976 RepID=UPI002163EAF3|nr:hypothetical protein [Pseudarthrobacter sp. NS4]
MWATPASTSMLRTRPGRLSEFVHDALARVHTVAVPFRIGEPVVGDDPFNGRREGLVAVKNGVFVGLETAGQIFFYDHRQVRRQD